jgi:hypothetical protein
VLHVAEFIDQAQPRLDELRRQWPADEHGRVRLRHAAFTEERVKKALA